MVWNLDRKVQTKHDFFCHYIHSTQKPWWQLLIMAVKGPIHDAFHPCPLGIINVFLVLQFLRGSTLRGPLGNPFLHHGRLLTGNQMRLLLEQ